MIAPLPALLVEPLVRAALAEDLGRAGDITSAATVPETARLRARVVVRAEGRLAGVTAAALTFALVDPAIRVEVRLGDGADAERGATILSLEGPARGILTAERVALNLLGHLSGVSTATRALVRAVEGTGARITCTRKTLPGLRALQKFAVRCGGGVNHRFGLDDALLIKDNHIVAAGGLEAAIARARSAAGHMVKLEIEVDTLDQLERALAAGADCVLLDNMDPATLREAVRRANKRAVLEASGGVALATVRAIAEAGVDFISSGALTHSAAALDVALDADALL